MFFVDHTNTKNRAQFHWDLEGNRIEGLFGLCNQFVSDLYKARDDIHKLEIEREKRRKKREKKKKTENAKEQYKKRLKQVQKPKRSIMDDVRNRKRKNTALLEKVGAKLTKTLEEKSKLIEAVNYKKQLPQEFKKNKIKRKMSNVYGKSVEKVKVVPKGRMRLPTIVSKKGLPSLPALKQGDEPGDNNNKLNIKNKTTKRKRSAVQKRKRTKGWFKKGKEPKPEPQIIRPAPRNAKGFYAQPSTSYNPLGEYENGYKNAYRRGRGISNNKEAQDNQNDFNIMTPNPLAHMGAHGMSNGNGKGKENKDGNRWRSDTPTNPTALSGLSQKDLKRGQQKASNIHQKWQQAHNPYAQPIGLTNDFKGSRNNHKRAQSMKVSSKGRINRAAYSPPNMGIVRLNKLGFESMNLNNKVKGKNKTGKIGNLKVEVKHSRKKSADLNIPLQLSNGQEDVFLLESPAVSPRSSNKKSSQQFHFDTENNWD